MEAYSTLLLTSGPAIQHILENGNVVDLPGDVTFICEVILFSRVIKSSKIKNIEIILKKRNT